MVFLQAVLRSFVVLTLLASIALSPVVLADTCTTQPAPGCAPQAVFGTHVNNLDVQGLIFDFGPKGFGTGLDARGEALPRVGSPGTSTPSVTPQQVLSHFVARGYCWHDDHAFLPADALTGISCDSHTTANNIDPGAVARQMFDHLALPDLRINMNPRLGMVAVPTWFWVEGYGGDVIPLTDNLVVSHQECHDVASRDETGNIALDSSGAPATRQECKTISDTITVNVRAFPRSFHWTFGDSHDQTVPCPDLAACPAGIGKPFTDLHLPSPIAHAYRWSSLGKNGSNDAYSVGLAITFGAQFRFSINGHSDTGWQSLGDRDLSWSALHQVQEAQAVLTRPCPVSDLLRC